MAHFESALAGPLPQVPYQGGHTIQSVQLITVTFAGYSLRSEVEAFGDWLVQSNWLETVGAEYGAGAGTHVAKIALADPAPARITDAELQALLAQRIADQSLPAPPSDVSDHLYAVYFRRRARWTRRDIPPIAAHPSAAADITATFRPGHATSPTR
jgi:hypothetical protein